MQVVAHEAELALEPAAAAAEREAGDAGVGHAAAGDREPVLLGRGVELAPRAARPRRAPSCAVGSTSMPFMPRRSTHDAVVAHRRAGDAVAAAVHRERQGRCSRARFTARDDVVGARAPGDQRRAAVDHPVEDRAGLVVAGVAGGDELAVEAGELEGRVPLLAIVRPIVGAPRAGIFAAPTAPDQIAAAPVIRSVISSVSSE